MNTAIKLLVIDDDEVDRIHLKRALHACGLAYELTELEGPGNVIDHILVNHYDCIFLDYVLPCDNGLSLLTKIRELGIKIPTVVITAHGNESIAVEMMKAGASDYVIKSDITGQFIGKVLRNMLRLNQVERQREQAEKALLISEARLAEAQRIAKIGNWELNTVTKAFYCSSQVYTLLGLESKDSLPTSEKFISYVHAEDREVLCEAFKNNSNDNSFNIDFRSITPLGLKYLNTQGYSVQDRFETRIIGTLQDITERKLFEQEIIKAREAAENSMKVRDIFLANMSHEIRTPMNAILGFTRLLSETNLSAEQKGFIDAIHYSGDNLLVVINDILDLSKIQSGKMNFEKSEFNLYELISDIVSDMRPKAQEKGLQLITNVRKNTSLMVKADAGRLDQVLTNLITNAIKFTGKGSVTIEANCITSSRHEIVVEFKVVDTGIGISEEIQSLIFKNFVQTSSDNRMYGGTGLGLAIVKSLVELQGGSISVSSQQDHGSVFTVHLPFEKSEEIIPQQPAPLPSTQALIDQLRGVSLLVAEDNAANQLLMRKVLQKAGCNVDIVSNGVEALEYLKVKHYDAILMDVKMPEMDGYEATHIIRNKHMAPVSNIAIIALTAHASKEVMTECLAAGMNDYISKPFKVDDLYSKIIKYTAKKDQAKVVSLSHDTPKIDLDLIYKICDGDARFLNNLVFVYDKQTPVFTEKLKAYVRSHNFEAIKAVCHQIKSSYGILKLHELDVILSEIQQVLKNSNTEVEITKISGLVNTVIVLISAINEEVKRNLRKTA